MRFARHAQIFRGPLDPAPVAAVVLLLMMFMLLGSLIYTPGELVELGQTLTVTSSNAIAFGGKTYTPGEWTQLRADLKTSPGNKGFSVIMEPGADPGLGRQVSNLFRITLPDGKNLTGTDNSMVAVDVDFRGQCFYQNRPVQDAALRTELALRLKNATRDARRLTLILRLDRAAEIQVQTHLCELASEVGITEVLLAARPATFGAQP